MIVDDDVTRELVRRADITLRRKLLFIRPFHHHVVSFQCALVVQHVMYDESESENRLVNTAAALLPHQRANVKTIHIYIHFWLRSQQNKSTSSRKEPVRLVHFIDDRRVDVLFFILTDETALKIDNVLQARKRRDEYLTVCLPIFVNAILFGAAGPKFGQLLVAMFLILYKRRHTPCWTLLCIWTISYACTFVFCFKTRELLESSVRA